MLVLPLGSHYRVWQLSLTFSSISCCQAKLKTFNKKYTLPSLAHADGRTRAHSWKKTHGLSHCKPCASAAHVEPSIPVSHCSPSCFHSYGCDFQQVRSSSEKVLCLATNRPQDCVWFGRGMEAVFMKLTMSFQMGWCSLHTAGVWDCSFLQKSLSTSPCRLKQDEKYKTFHKNSQGSSGPQEPSWPSARCWGLKPQLRKAPLKMDPLQDAISREAHGVLKIFSQILLQSKYWRHVGICKTQ